MGAGTATAALIEQDHAEGGGVKVAAHGGAASATGSAMQHDDGDAVGVAALFDIDAMPIAHVDNPLIERIDRRVEEFDCALLA
jgi:hypothetical protein